MFELPLMELAVHLVLTAALLLLVANMVTGLEIDSWWAAFIVALLLGLINAIVRPVMIALTIPITVVTFGLFLFVINALMLWLAAAISPGVKVDGFGPALGVAALFSLLNFLFGWIVFILIGIGTLGIGFILFFVTIWIVNAIMLSVTDAMLDSFEIDGFGWALGASFLISVFAAIGQAIVF